MPRMETHRLSIDEDLAAAASTAIDLGLRLGEGTNAALGFPVLRAAAAVSTEMATFASAGVSERGSC